MQELNVQPTNPTPYMPAGGMYNFNPTPGAGGLPALSGLPRNVNPMARELQAQGRGDDKMLVHMTPDEVNDLQTLAMQSGTTMTINPNTGLPEAGLLGKVFKKLLPALAGAGLMFIPGVNAIAAAGIVGGGSTLLTGSLKKGLMAGLSAYGGASLARGLGAGVASAAKQAAAAGATTGTGVGAGTGTGISATRDAVGIGSKFGAGFGGAPGVSAFAPGAAGTGLTSAVNAGTIGTSAAKTGLAAIPGNFARAAQAGLPGGIIGKAAPMLAASGLVNTAGGVADATRTPGQAPVDQNNWPQEGPYMPTRRTLAPRLTGPGGRGEIMYFDQPDFGGYLTASGELRGLGAAQPQSYASQGLTGFAEGGETKLAMGNTGGGSRQLTAEETFAMFKETVPIEKRQVMAQFAGDANAYKAMSEGIIDPKTGQRSQFAGAATATSMKPGTIQQFGDTYMRLGDDRRWYTTEAPKPTTTTTDERVRNPNDIRRDDRPTTNTTNTVTGTPPGTPTSKTDGLPPGATPSGYGVYTLADKYTPSFTKVEDFVTEKVNPYTGGTTQTNKLVDYIKSYQTSPGPVTASLDYAAGQSPSQRNRAYAEELARQAAARRAAASTSTATRDTGTSSMGGYYYNPATNSFYENEAFTGSTYTFDPVTGKFVGTATDTNFARGGGIHMDDGAFVVDARTVSELGNGSSSAGQELLARLGGRPVKGPGDGVSDSIRANIGGTQEARVARDEVIFPAKAVKKLGGAKKLYALMDKAHAARKKAGRGSDTKLRKGLGAL